MATHGNVGRRVIPKECPHIVIAVQNLPVPLDRRVWLECRALVAAGFRVSVICPAGIEEAHYELRAGIELHRYPAPPPNQSTVGFLREYAHALAHTGRLVTRIARNGPIAVFQACNPPDLFFPFAMALRRSGTRFVYDQHDLCPELYVSRFRRPHRWVLKALVALERATYRQADQVIVMNESFRRIAMARGSLAAAAVTVVRSGPSDEEMKRQSPVPALRRGRRHLCVYLGVMGPQDGVELLLESAAELVHHRGRHDVQFALLGFGDCLADLRAQSTRLGLDPWVDFVGLADDPTIARYLSTADLGLSPDPKNVLNDLCTMNKTLEYMAYELPIVGFDLTESRVSAGRAASYVPSGDVVAFATAIEELLQDPIRRAQMGAYGRARIERALSWEHSAPAYVEVFRRLAKLDRRLAEPDPLAETG